MNSKILQSTIEKLPGTKFQKKVWLALAKIPYGKTATYAEVAKMIGKPKACRAVGNACGKNPLPIIIPCHRVIGSNRRLGGFTGGLKKKIQLLKKEGSLRALAKQSRECS